MLSRLRLITAGESHGPKLTAMLEGLPAGLRVDRAAMAELLARRQRGFGAGGRMKIETDRGVITAGVPDGRTSGGPIAIEVPNRDWQNWQDREVAPMTRPRPGHADLVGAQKYGYDDLRFALERASARETAARVAAGALCLQVLRELGVEIGGHVRQLGAEHAGLDDPGGDSAAEAAWRARAGAAAVDEMAAADPDCSARYRAEVKRAIAARDTLGGVLEVVALGLPPGLGSFVAWDRRLDARIAFAMASIPAMKGVELGDGFANAGKLGSEVHDAIAAEAGRLRRPTNRCGGLEGGVSTGAPLVVRVAMKPIATTLVGLPTVDLATGEPGDTVYERSDICAVPRALPIAEAMLGLVLCDALLEKLGGDSMAELQRRIATLPRDRIADVPMRAEPWRFAYEEA